eukprot:Blabericola_migrator_1__1835@NODE_149_length_12902_cov_32_504636_g130_i0_p2_GENE_NODE_149_length_12902_cov_32_504636_g130_i0NODE_149_length_12902_cov_32_504636_g130_i0_p2_ORF_typecomplete_len1196_score172_88_NODE_149_length_12902_cov_32_504636_g130_i013588
MCQSRHFTAEITASHSSPIRRKTPSHKNMLSLPKILDTFQSPTPSNVMRGIVLEGTTTRLSLFLARAFVLVSWPNGPCNGGAPGNESAPERTSATNHEIEDLLDPEFPLETDSGVASLAFETLNSWFSPDVISTIATQIAVPSGFERSYSDADGEPPLKKLCCTAPSEPWSSSGAMSISEDQTLEGTARDVSGRCCDVVEPAQYSAQAEVANTMQQPVVPADRPPLIFEHCDDWAHSTAWSEGLLGGAVFTGTFDCDANCAGALPNQQATLYANTTHVIHGGPSRDATAPIVELIPKPMPPTGTSAAQQLDKQWNQGTLLSVGKVQSPHDQPVLRYTAGARTSLITPVGGTSQNQSLAGASRSAISTNHLETTANELNASGQMLASSVPTTSTSDGDPPVDSLFNRSQRFTSEKRHSGLYGAARELLLSQGTKGIRRLLLERTRAKARLNVTNASYLSSSWLLERLVLHDIVPTYLSELQTAFECYGYDSVRIPDLVQRALDLAYTLRKLRTTDAPYQKHRNTREELACLGWAAEITRDAFFDGRLPRSNLKAYLRSKLRTQNAGKLQLPVIRGQLPDVKGNLARLKADFHIIKKLFKSRATSIGHPLDFYSFFTDVLTLVRNTYYIQETVEDSSATTDQREQGKATKRDIVITKSEKVIAVLTKYQKLFKIDLANEVRALLKEAPEELSYDRFRSAVKEGYVPFDLSQPKLLKDWERYSISAHCVLGSITDLYRRLFDVTNKTTESKTTDLETDRDLEACDTDASDGNHPATLDVVQAYLLQPLPTPHKEGKLSVQEFDLLSAASEALELWKQGLIPSPNELNVPDVPKDLVPRTIGSDAPFGSPQWVLIQLIHEYHPESHPWRRNELQLALDLCGHQLIDIRSIFAKAYVLAAAILAKRRVPFEDVIKQLKSCGKFPRYFLAADIIHAALFRTWPQRQNLTEYHAQHLRYDVLVQHKECLREVVAKRERWHPCMGIRLQKGDKEVLADWSRIRIAEGVSPAEEKNNHPLSFDRFWEDVTLITRKYAPAIPAIASKYRILFNRDIVEDLKSIREQAPKICYSDSFVKGIEEGFVPYRYAQLLAASKRGTMVINKNVSLLLGAIVDYYISLVSPADTTVSPEMSFQEDTAALQEISVTTTLSSDDDPKSSETEERMAQLMAILHQAPPQKPPTIRATTVELKECHPVAQYLFSRS